MADLIVPVDAELAFVAELDGRMPDRGFPGKWGTRIPNPVPGEFGRVLAVGGGERDLVTDQPTVTVEYFAGSETQAQRGCAFAVAVLQAAGRAGAVGDVPCYRVRVVSLPSNLPMPSVPGLFRFTATVSADLRRSTV